MAGDKSQRPPDSDFQQQNLKAWQPILTPGWVIGTFFLVGFLFLPIGILVLHASENVHQVEARYDNINENFVNLTIPHDMEPPIYFYYKLTSFYQNHRTYVKSRSDKQLRGEDVDQPESCSPLKEYQGKIMYPCGLIANSYFSDQFDQDPPTITRQEDSSVEPLIWTDKGIAWKSDVDTKFKQGNFNPDTMIRMGPSNITLNHTAEDFIVWMRTAGLPDFKKLRYIIKDQTLKEGDVVTINIVDRFQVDTFEGTKSIVISTTSWLGGKNDFLGYAYVVVASICLFLGCVFGIKHKVSPRPLGDMHYFTWSGSNSAK